MSRINTVNILGVPHQVTYLDTDAAMKEAALSTDEDSHIMGCIDYAKARIYIYDDGQISDEQIRVTLWHEILHGISYMMSLSLNDESNHEDLDRLSVALFNLLKDNKDL